MTPEIELAIIQIVALAVQQLTQMQETFNSNLFKYKDGSYSCIELDNKEVCKDISIFEAALNMREDIKAAIEKNEAIVLYICPDNQLISLDTLKPNADELEYFDKEEIVGYDKFYSTKD